MEAHCRDQGPPLGSRRCSWADVPRLQRLEGHVVTAKHVTDPLAEGLSVLLVNMVKEDEVIQPATDLNKQLAICGPIIITVASVFAVCLSRAITRPLRVVRDNMFLLGEMRIEESLRQNRAQRFQGTRFSEVRDLRTSFETAAQCLRRWRDTEIARRERLEEEKSLRIAQVIRRAEEGAGKLLHPMVLTWVPDFLAMQDFRSYERLRDEGKLVFLDTEMALTEFRADNRVIFLSHQWLSWGTPDPEIVHFPAMKSAVKQVCGRLADKKEKGGCRLDKTYVWVDYCSIAQEHRGMQTLAISSLPYYASSADAFVVIAPPARHTCSNRLCDLESYNSRGWCRAEMLAKVCGSGLNNFFVLSTSDGALRQISEAQLSCLPLDVFEGSFSCCEQGHQDSDSCDKESLVEAVLGLYALALHAKQCARPTQPNAPIISHIRHSKERFFPETFTFRSHEGWEEERELFGGLVAAMEAHVEGLDPVMRASWSKSFGRSDTGQSSHKLSRNCSPQHGGSGSHRVRALFSNASLGGLSPSLCAGPSCSLGSWLCSGAGSQGA